MLGKGIITGMGITLKHFFDSYAADRRRGFGKRYLPNHEEHAGPVPGYITVQYPEEKLKVPENFRFLPVLIKDDETGADWCTACGICARVCPPQCIWIVRAKKDDGKPMPVIEGFWIDTSICMQCGYCAEYCPFDAIKMDHQYELASEERWNTWIHDKERLTVPNAYYTKLHPRQAAEEKAIRDEKEAKKSKGGRASKETKAAGAATVRPAPDGKSETVKPSPATAAPEQQQTASEPRADATQASATLPSVAKSQTTGPAAEQQRPADAQSIATSSAEAQTAAQPDNKESTSE